MSPQAFKTEAFEIPPALSTDADPFLTPGEPTPAVQDWSLGGAMPSSISDAMASLDQDLNSAIIGRKLSHALAALKGVSPMLNALAGSGTDLSDQEGLNAFDKMMAMSTAATDACVTALGVDTALHQWVKPAAMTILAGVAAKRWEKTPDITVEQFSAQMNSAFEAAVHNGFSPHFGDDWDLVQPRVALTISLSASVDNVMTEYDNVFTFFQARGKVVEQVTGALLSSSHDVLETVERRMGEIEEPSRTRLLQSVVRDGGLLMARLWRPEAAEAIADIKTRDRAERARIVGSTGYPLDQLFNKFQELHQQQVVVLLSGLGVSLEEPAPAPGM